VAKRLRSVVFRTWPEVKDYHERVKALADAGYLTSLGNGMVRRETSAAAAANHFFQNLAAQGAKAALYEVEKAGLEPVAFLHDEIMIQTPIEEAQERAKALSRIMVASMGHYTPDIRVRATPVLMERWYKGAEAVYEGGRLVPWSPK
jgi:hypothetical protein